MVHVFPHQCCSREVGVYAIHPPLHITRNVSGSQGPYSLKDRQTDMVNKERNFTGFFLLHFPSPYSQSSSALEELFAQILSSCFLLCRPSEGPRHNTTIIYAHFLLMLLGPFRFNIRICLKSLLHLLSSE